MSGLEIILRDAEAIFKRARLDRLQGTNILVTGASGLIGTHILACLCHLSKCGISVQVYAHMLSQMPPHLTELVGEGRFKVLQDDLADFNSYLRLPEADVIIHAAGYAQPTRFMENPIAVLQINTSATISLLKRLRQNGSFLFLSSSEIYIGLKDLPAAETAIGTTTPFHPRASYIEGKRSGEAICNAFRLQGIRSVSARLGDVYGPGTRKHDTRVLNSFIEKALCHHRIDLLDLGTGIRTYCYVSDAVELLWRVLLDGREAVYNVGGRSTITIAQLAQTIGSLTNTPVVFPSTEIGVPGAPTELQQDLTRIDTEFGKNDYIDLEEGLRRTIDWQRIMYR